MALEIYQRILRLQPLNTRRPDPRVGIGLCFEQLNMHVQARMAFERAIELVILNSYEIIYSTCN
jgi:Flp pilus assembly protein TadD